MYTSICLSRRMPRPDKRVPREQSQKAQVAGELDTTRQKRASQAGKRIRTFSRLASTMAACTGAGTFITPSPSSTFSLLASMMAASCTGAGTVISRDNWRGAKKALHLCYPVCVALLLNELLLLLPLLASSLLPCLFCWSCTPPLSLFAVRSTLCASHASVQRAERRDPVCNHCARLQFDCWRI